MSKHLDNLERVFYAQQTQPPVLGEDGEVEEEILSFETGLATNAILCPFEFLFFLAPLIRLFDNRKNPRAKKLIQNFKKDTTTMEVASYQKLGWAKWVKKSLICL